MATNEYFNPGIDNEATLRRFLMICSEDMTNVDIHIAPKECSFPPNPDLKNKIGYKYIVPNDKDDAIAAARHMVKPGHPYYNLSAEARAKLAALGSLSLLFGSSQNSPSKIHDQSMPSILH